MNKLDQLLNDVDPGDKLCYIGALLQVDSCIGLGEFDKATEIFMASIY